MCVAKMWVDRHEWAITAGDTLYKDVLAELFTKRNGYL